MKISNRILRIGVNACAILVVLALQAPRALAQLDVYEGFSDPIGNFNGHTDSLDLGWTGTWNSVNRISEGDLSYKNLLTEGNELTTNGLNEISIRTLSKTYGVQPAAGTTLWVSFLTDVNASSAIQPGTSYAGVSLFYNNGSSNLEELFMGIPNTATTYGMQFDTAHNGPILTSGTVANTASAFLVYRLQYLASSLMNVDMYIDPTPGAASPGAPALELTNQNAIEFNEVRIQSGSNLSVDFDEIRIGQSYSDVSPTDGTPEPSEFASMGILILGTAYVISQRRSRRYRAFVRIREAFR